MFVVFSLLFFAKVVVFAKNYKFFINIICFFRVIKLFYLH